MNLIKNDISLLFPDKVSAMFYRIATSIGLINGLVGKKTISKGIFKKISDPVGDLHIASEALLNLLTESAAEKNGLNSVGKKGKNDLASLYHSSMKALHGFRIIYAHFDKIDFFNDDSLKRRCDDTLNNFYKIEVHLRMLALSSSVPAPQDKELIEMAAKVSVNALS